MSSHRRSGSLPKTFSITNEVLASKSEKPTDEAPILRLPANILTNIYSLVRRPADQVKFALTCKTIARIAKNTELNMSLVLSPKTLRIRPYDAADLKNELQCWESLHKCKSCKGLLPKQRIWVTKEGVRIATLKHVDWMWAVKDWIGGGDMCPPCRIAEYYESDVKGWLQCRPEGFAKVTMFMNVEKECEVPDVKG